MAFIAFEVHTVVQALNKGNGSAASETAASQPGGGGGGAQRGGGVPNGGPDLPDPGVPTMAYPEICHGLVQLDESKDMKLSDEEKKKIVPQLKQLADLSDKMHAAERGLLDSLDPKQKKWVEEHREQLMKASIQPGEPPIAYALYHFTGGKGVASRNTRPPQRDVSPPAGGGQPTPPSDPRVPPPSQGGPEPKPGGRAAPGGGASGAPEKGTGEPAANSSPRSEKPAASASAAPSP
jgi:hypothetical protein